jgi:hypothetical protein
MVNGKMETCKDGVMAPRESHGLLSGVMAAIGSAWTSRRARKAGTRKVQLVSWARQADTDSWFLLQLEQSKNRALYYYTRNQTR